MRLLSWCTDAAGRGWEGCTVVHNLCERRKNCLAASVPLIPNLFLRHIFVAHSRAPLSFLWSTTLVLPPGHHCMLIPGQHYASSGAPTDACTGYHSTLCPGHHSTHSWHHYAHCSAPLIGSLWGSTLCRPQGRTGCGVGLFCWPRHTAHTPFLSRDKPSS